MENVMDYNISGNGAGHKAGLRTKCHAGDHDDAGDGFEIGNGKGNTASHRQCGQNGDDHQFPGLGSAGLKSEKERQHSFQNHQGAGQIMPAASQLGA